MPSSKTPASSSCHPTPAPTPSASTSPAQPSPRCSSWPSSPAHLAVPPLARNTQAPAVLVDPAFEQIAAATLRISNPYLAFARALELLYQPASYAPGIHPTAIIAPTAQVAAGAHIGAYAVIGDHVVIG